MVYNGLMAKVSKKAMTEARAIEVIKWGIALAVPPSNHDEFMEALAYVREHKLEDQIMQSDPSVKVKSKYPSRADNVPMEKPVAKKTTTKKRVSKKATTKKVVDKTATDKVSSMKKAMKK